MSRATRASTVLVAAALAVLVAGCGAEAPSHQYGAWILVSADTAEGTIELIDSHPVTLTISTSDFGGTAACNAYGGEVVTKSGVWLPSTMEVTAMACEPAAVMTLEAAYLDALDRATQHEATPDELVLLGPDGITLRFERAGS
ncbi:MAG: META domain-containing protein [Actinomycetota bacterium]|nr:META domain-containing protein [Actinomycetota bacterium]